MSIPNSNTSNNIATDIPRYRDKAPPSDDTTDERP